MIVLREEAEARIRTAVSGIQTLSAVLMRREMDAELSNEEAVLVFGPAVASGFLEAIACCAEVIECTLSDKVFTREVDVGSAEDRQIMEIAAYRR